MEQYPALLRRLLEKRGLTERENAERFLNPDYERDLHDPFLLKDMDRAVERIARAMQENERIVVYGDYDCDGIPGAVVLHDYFKKIGYENFSVYIPHRYDEGYGLNVAAIEKLAAEGAGVIITVDSGITDHEAVARANELGVDVIVTDHHLPKETLPPAYAVINPKRADDTYPNDDICGGGLAFKLVQGMTKGSPLGDLKGNPLGWEKWLLDAAAISTIADMVPLTGENRAIAYFGLKVLRKSPRPGLMRLLRKARVDQRELCEDDVGFTIGPHINAASRMGVPFDAFRFLASDDPVEAGALSDKLMEYNGERKELVASMLHDTCSMLHTTDHVLVLGREDWRPGVLGLLANKLAEEHHKPVFVWGMNGTDHAKGSCRTAGELNIVDLMGGAGDIFLDFGGHHSSGGFSVARDRIDELRPRLIEAFGKLEIGNFLEIRNSKLEIDGSLAVSDVTDDLHREVSRLAPFGIGNPKPLFKFQDVPMRGARRFGKNKEHLELDLGALKAIRFFTKTGPMFEDRLRTSFTAHIERSNWNGGGLRLRVVDFLP